MRKYAVAVHKQYISTAEKTTIRSGMLTCLIDLNKLLSLLKKLSDGRQRDVDLLKNAYYNYNGYRYV